MSCCPPSSLGYLQADATAAGTTVTSGACEFYQVGESSSSAILLFPDVWGWNGGRTRLLADEFAQGGYRVYVPKVLNPTLEGGTDGDGLPPNFDLSVRGGEFGPWVTQIPFVGGIDKKVEALIAYAKEQGATKLGMVGCCWGAWAAFHASAICSDIKCAVAFHPSCQLEGMFGGDVNELCGRVQCPFYFMPANGDSPDLYGPQGTLVTALQGKFGKDKTRTKLFSDMSHGWVPRGDIKDDKVKRDVQLAMDEARAYLAEMLPPK
mmetsp:Transcript_7499/g.18200  ORF Transcript_7499/g.18200 Transcript_7499/m.18200 type:complete len:264 (-) Transcript_7499:114-905(-)|eukprot:CAMPEP_0173434538 /NCGR_PEP_ID=MMETSP1357-20121228/13104_1 /TAXON_ID=77926 /ORGANISM="Hemiselmis rufescens, Strain PCC563" /LENGTH=263 /DNA_ID=CAMNT_0014399415 /DNA_START=16 /DNA_END=807 /DNA_ORIENTATION=-